ncbi:metallophosphoesterase [Thermococcus sp. MV11]|uniref:metallophosphoesterase n=1 Tax=Thermococcus sp. MV11 TaxID=1638267 RepID=UPI0014308EF8|nr:metallophosphoesterase [Thermococcus sp. MV11]NJE03313.1 YfcE family phosphodiesterase [Thermococcus sp. MV11]
MRIVSITDVHGDRRKAEALSRVLSREDFDILLIAGDVTNFSNAETAREVLGPLLDLGVPTLAVHGNCDGRDVPALLEELGVGVHDRRREIKGVGFIGIGGSNITPFNTIWELTEDEIRAILERNYRPGDVILSHVPPRNTKTDLTHSGLHVGSSALREFIEAREPPLVVVGHIHEARAVDKIGKTVIVNPGPLFRGHYAVIDFDEREKRVENVELLRL